MLEKMHVTIILLYVTNFLFCLLTFIFYEVDAVADRVIESKPYHVSGAVLLSVTSTACLIQYFLIAKNSFFPRNKSNINSVEWEKHVKKERMTFINTTTLYAPNIKDIIEKFIKYIFTISFSIAIAIYFFVSEYDKKIWSNLFTKKDFFILVLKLIFSFLYLLQVFTRPNENHVIRKTKIFTICILISWGTIFFTFSAIIKKDLFCFIVLLVLIVIGSIGQIYFFTLKRYESSKKVEQANIDKYNKNKELIDELFNDKNSE